MVPDKATACGLPPALSVNCKEAVSVCEPLGENATVTLQELLGASDCPLHVSAGVAKFAAFGPVTVTVGDSAASPQLLSVTVCADALWNDSDAGWRFATGVPLPLSGSSHALRPCVHATRVVLSVEMVTPSTETDGMPVPAVDQVGVGEVPPHPVQV